MGIKAGYVRLSRDEDGQSESIEGQKTVIAHYYRNVLHYTGEIVFFVDDNCSGMNFDRPDFQRMRREALNNNLDIVVFKDLSRFGRDSADTQKYWKEFVLKCGVRLIAASQNQDSLDRHTRKTLGLYAWLNEQYVEDISEKILENFRSRQKKGDLIITVPYGYVKRGKSVSVDEFAAETVKRIFSLYLAGYGYKKIASIMNAEGILTPSAYKNRSGALPAWSFQAVKNILTNEFYTGVLLQGKTYKKEIKGRSFRTPPDRVLKFPGHHEAIIDREVFDLVQETLKDRKKRSFRGAKITAPRLFSGKIVCEKCKKTYLFKSRRKGGPGYYICGTRYKYGPEYCKNITIPENRLAGLIREQLREKTDENREVLPELKSRAGRRPHYGKTDMVIARIRKEIEKRENTLKKIYLDRLEARTGFPEYLLEQLISRTSSEIDSLRRQLESATAARDASADRREAPEDLDGKLLRFINRPLARKDVEIFIKEIRIDGGIIDVYWNI
ncbi:MAG: recombinase family protein [Peptococcaceae bacterium]|nr:recombinase family protein [Peptococcaceae bacterium]